MTAELKRINKEELEATYPSKKGQRVQRISFSYDNAVKFIDWCKTKEIDLTVEPKLEEWIKEETDRRHWTMDMIPLIQNLEKRCVAGLFSVKGLNSLMSIEMCSLPTSPGLGKDTTSNGCSHRKWLHRKHFGGRTENSCVYLLGRTIGALVCRRCTV